MKKAVFYTLLLLSVFSIFCIGGCADKHAIKEDAPSQTPISAESKEEQTMVAVRIPILDVDAVARQSENGLTAEEAEKLCRDVLGERADETGFPISYRCIGGATYKGKSYYVMHMAWLVDTQHWSYIGNCLVSSDGQEIYDGIATDEQFEISSLRWQK